MFTAALDKKTTPFMNYCMQRHAATFMDLELGSCSQDERGRTCAVLADVLGVGLAELLNGVHDVLHAARIPHGLG